MLPMSTGKAPARFVHGTPLAAPRRSNAAHHHSPYQQPKQLQRDSFSTSMSTTSSQFSTIALGTTIQDLTDLTTSWGPNKPFPIQPLAPVPESSSLQAHLPAPAPAPPSPSPFVSALQQPAREDPAPTPTSAPTASAPTPTFTSTSAPTASASAPAPAPAHTSGPASAQRPDRAPVPSPAPNTTLSSIKAYMQTLNQFYQDGTPDESLRLAAYEATVGFKGTMKFAVNSKNKDLVAMQSLAVAEGAVPVLLHIVESGLPSACDSLQLLCFRNAAHAEMLVELGVVKMLANSMMVSKPDMKAAQCYLLSAIVAFTNKAHRPVVDSGLVPRLVNLINLGNRSGSNSKLGNVQMYAAAVLRNLAHCTATHAALHAGGAVDAMVNIMHEVEEPACRINAATAVACLVGHEENNPKLQLDEKLVMELLEVLDASCQGTIYHGVFWTVWKLCQGLASLTVNDKNKELLASQGGVDLLYNVLNGVHHENEKAQRYAVSALWNLAFNEGARSIIVETPGLVDKIRHILSETECSRTKEVAKGALWTLGLEQDVKSLHDNTGRGALAVAQEKKVGHIMLSYEWGAQESVMVIKEELERAGYETWMDIDKMSGSTLEAMAEAVEDSAVVLICVSKKYKMSQACRTEAEYAFQTRKKIVPIIMEKDYRPTGWLGAIMGTRLYFDMSTYDAIPSKAPHLFRELGNYGRPGFAQSREIAIISIKEDDSYASPEQLTLAAPLDPRLDGWTFEEVDEWLNKIRCPEACIKFREQEIDGVALAGLARLTTNIRFVHTILRDQLGIQSLGSRLRIVEELYRMVS